MKIYTASSSSVCKNWAHMLLNFFRVSSYFSVLKYIARCCPSLEWSFSFLLLETNTLAYLPGTPVAN